MFRLLQMEAATVQAHPSYTLSSRRRAQTRPLWLMRTPSPRLSAKTTPLEIIPPPSLPKTKTTTTLTISIRLRHHSCRSHSPRLCTWAHTLIPKATPTTVTVTLIRLPPVVCAGLLSQASEHRRYQIFEEPNRPLCASTPRPPTRCPPLSHPLAPFPAHHRSLPMEPLAPIPIHTQTSP